MQFSIFNSTTKIHWKYPLTFLYEQKSTARVRIECRLALERGNEDNLSLSIAVRVHRGRYSGRHGEGKWSGGGRRGAASQRHGWRGRGGCADGWYQFHRARSIAEHLVIGSAPMFAGETRRCRPGQIFFNPPWGDFVLKKKRIDPVYKENWTRKPYNCTVNYGKPAETHCTEKRKGPSYTTNKNGGA